MTRSRLRPQGARPAAGGLWLGLISLAGIVVGCRNMGCQGPTTAATPASTPAPPPESRVEQTGPVQPRRVSFDPRNPARVLVMQANGVTSVWNIADPKKPSQALEIITPALDVEFSADGQSIFTAGRDGAAYRWNASGQQSWRAGISPGKAVRTIGVSLDGTVVAAGGDDGKVHILSVDGAELGSVETAQEMVLGLNFSPKGDRLACDGSDTRVRIFRRIEKAPGIELETTFRKPNERYAKMLPNLIRLDVQWGWQESVVFSPDGTRVLTANLDGTCQFWTVDGERRHHPFSNHGDYHVRCVAYSPLGNLVASGGFDGRTQLWTTTGKPVGHPLTAHNNVITSVAFSPDGKTIATAGMDNTVRFWDTQGNRLGMLPRGHVPLVPRRKQKWAVPSR